MRNSAGGEISHHAILMLFTFFWGANFILAEVALKEMQPISFSVSRFAIGGITMLVMMYLQCYYDAKRGGIDFSFLPSIEKKDIPRLLLVSVLGATLAPWIGIEGLGLSHGSRAAIWLALGPAVSCLFGYVLTTEKIGRAGITGALLAGFGTLLLAIEGITVSGYWLGDAFLCIALILTVIELHLIKPLAHKYGSISMVALRTLIGGSLYFLIASPALLQEQWLVLDIWTWIAILAGGSIGVGIGQWIKVRALRSLGPTRVVIYGNLVPIATIIIAWFSIGQNPTIYEVVAGLLIIIGAIFIQVIDTPQKNNHTFSKEDDELSVVTSGKQD